MATRRVTMREAADILGVSKEAVRKRVIRGTLRSDMGEDGRRYVYVDAGGDEPPTHESDVLTSEMRDRIAFLERELERRADEAGELRRIIAALTSRIPEIESPSEPRESSVTPAEPVPNQVPPEPERAEPHAATGGAQPVSEHLSWDDPSRLRWLVVWGILSILASTGSFFIAITVIEVEPIPYLLYLLGSSVPPYLAASSQLLLVVPTLVAIPALFGFRIGREVRSRRFGLHLVAIGALIVLGNFLLYSRPFHYLIGEHDVFFSVTPGLIYISAAVLGNARQRRNRERLMEQRPAGSPPESAAAAQRWTPQQQAIVGLAGTILSALIGLIGTILTVMASGNGG